MSKARPIRWAKVEYQPNLRKAVKPVPLGIVAEVIDKDLRKIFLIGREPIGDVRGLQLENTWGPFRGVVSEWAENFAKTTREFVDELEQTQYALDELAQRWRWNVYLRDLTTSQSVRGLDAYGIWRYTQYVGNPISRPRPRQRKKWARLKNEVAIPA